MLNKLNIRCAYIGTLGFYKCGIIKELENTTPDIDELYEYLNECANENIKYVVMEVSSHSLIQDRIYGLKFDSVIFTNLTEDHLDYHKNMEEYINSKKNIILHQNAFDIAILNNDNDITKNSNKKPNVYRLRFYLGTRNKIT